MTDPHVKEGTTRSVGDWLADLRRDGILRRPGYNLAPPHGGSLPIPNRRRAIYRRGYLHGWNDAKAGRQYGQGRGADQ